MRAREKLIKVLVKVPIWTTPHWWTIAYKIIPELTKDFGELLDIPLDEKFQKVIGGYIDSVIEGKMPPVDIAPTILNIANDLVNGRDIVIRTGDYIAIQKHLRGIM